MGIAAEYHHWTPSASQGISPHGMNIAILCLWAVFGFALTGLAFTLGLGADVMEALATAG